MREYKRFLRLAIALMCAVLVGVIIYNVFRDKPGRFILTVGEDQTIDLSIPYTLRIDSDNVVVDDGESRRANLNSCVVLESDVRGSYEGRMYLFGIIPTRKVQIDVVDKNMLYAGGNILGLKFDTEGALVVGFGNVNSDKRASCPAKNILNVGDYIVMANGKKVTDKELLVKQIRTNGVKPMVFVIKRGNEYINVKITPQIADDGTAKIGAMIRDDMAGVGTLSFVDPANNTFGMLGHGLYDVDSNVLVDFSDASVYLARTVGIKKGQKNDVGEIAGAININKENLLGKVSANTNLGVCGSVDGLAATLDKLSLSSDDLYEIGHASSVKKGKAYIINACLGSRKRYEIEITDVGYGRANKEKSLKIKVIDKTLLNKTGGIIQGMSGSPIIQDGKIVGVVTHVSVNNPQVGYGIFIDDMLKIKRQ